MSGEGYIAADRELRCRNLDEIRAGLAGDQADRWFWLGKARTRRDALAEDKPMFGLLPHEEDELVALNELLDANA